MSMSIELSGGIGVMTINKRIIMCSIVVSTACVFSLFVFKNNTLTQNIMISLLTGAIISFMTAEIYYLSERQKIICAIKDAIPVIYLNLKQIHKLTGEILPQIIYVQQLDGLNYRRLLSLADLNMNFVQQCHISGFSFFVKNRKLSCAVREFSQYTDCLYNLKDCLGKLECAVLDADIIQSKLYIKQANNQIILPEESKLLQDKRNLVNIRTAKVHEYEASLLQKLDLIADQFFVKPKHIWTEHKKMLDQKAMQIFDDV